ncbi:response regulator [Halalkalibacterium ligniniphilum]|uniref:response regulator n=1 Tax=Halalkalibacterium ligniniphilum TaxID=1134413 RepID=UPI00034D8BB0|nr:response regulator [Halalkalibacterium ligniniphilum]
MEQNIIHVLLIEDDPMVQEVNRMFIEKVEGFSVKGIASTGDEGLEKLMELSPDLILLDIYMPKQDGLSLIQEIRERNIDVDIIAVTAANDTKTVKALLRAGVVDYIVKPFTFERLETALSQYRDMHHGLKEDAPISQDKFDEMIKLKQQARGRELPKGLHGHTLNQVLECLKEMEQPRSAEEIGAAAGLARVTVRRYLNYLESIGEVDMHLSYGTIGRPIQTYVLKRRGMRT